MNKKESFHKRIEHASCFDLSYEGRGVTRVNGEVVFVNDMFPGDEGDIEIDYRRNGMLFGHVKKLSKESNDRVKPVCPVCYQCGGCAFQCLSYEAQLSFKQKKVKEQFKKIAKMDVDVLPTLGMENPYYYRNKVQPLIKEDIDGHIVSGFYKEGTHKIVKVDRCYIEDMRANTVLMAIRNLLEKHHIPAYEEDTGTGVIRRVLIKTSLHYNEIMVVLITTVDRFPSRESFVRDLLKVCPEVTTVVQNINPRRTSVILGEKERVLFGKGTIKDSISGLTFNISSKSFYQTNPTMVQVLYDVAMEFADLKESDVVFDAYSGIGTIGLIAAKKGSEVISVEIVPEAVEDANRNAKENNLGNFSAYVGDAGEFIREMAEDKKRIDVLFMDPPRKGSDMVFLESIMKIKPNRIVYVSCDASTLARDVKVLSKMYEIKKIRPVDMFPHTPHVECVVLLQRKMGQNS